MVHDRTDVIQAPASLDQIAVRFDEQRLVSDAGLLLTGSLAGRLGVERLVNDSVWLGHGVPGAALPGRKVMSLVHGMLAGADSIDDINVLRAGSTGLGLGHTVMAPSTLGTFLRAFTFGHVRQLDHVLDESLRRAWEAGGGPAAQRLVIDIDSFVGEVHGYQKQGASYGYTKQLGYHPLVAIRAGSGEVIHIRNRKGKANTQRGNPRFVDELLARVRRAGATGTILIRADTGFENHKLFKTFDARGVEFSIGVKQRKPIRALIDLIDEADWITLADYPEGGEAQIAETKLHGWRLIARRTRLVGKQAEQIEQLLFQQRLLSKLSSFFGGLALVLACIGLYGLLSYEVAQRTQEIGVRAALGAQPLDVMKLVLGEGAKLVLAGLVAGILGAVAATRLMTSLLFGVSATDPWVVVSVAILLP